MNKEMRKGKEAKRDGRKWVHGERRIQRDKKRMTGGTTQPAIEK